MGIVALVGNPNCGKTTLFNALTGSNQHIGNWPGVTVEKKEGKFKYKEKQYTVFDLPGIYSLGAYSEDEIVARDFILSGSSDVVIDVVDATNLERNLYLTSQLLEMGIKVVIALNMMDEAKQKNIEIDINALSEKLGIPIVATIASKNKGIDDLIEKAIEYAKTGESPKVNISYGEEIDREIERISSLLSKSNSNYPSRWLAIKLLEGDGEVYKLVEREFNLPEDLLLSIKEKSAEYELEIVDKRYAFIGNIINSVVKKPSKEVETITDKIDKIVTHKYLGIPIFALIMFIIFQLTFAIGQELLGGYVGDFVGFIGENVVDRS